LRGQTLDDDGAVLAGVAVVATSADGGLSRRVVSGSDGSFCVPTVNDLVEVSFEKSTATTRFFARGVFTPEGVGSCVTNTCTDIGPVNLASQDLSGCIVGRLVDGESTRPFNDAARVLFDGTPVAAVRPREDGTFCLEVALAAGLTVQDPLDDRGCAREREFDVDVPQPAPLGGTCANETACLDIGEVDFADFCFGS
jgi:hypothetical protein